MCDQGHLWYNCSCHSTGIILKGKFDWYDPSSRLSTAAQSVFNRISNLTDLPRIPNYIMELQRLLDNPNASTGQMAQLIKYDSMLAATVLRVANNRKPPNGQQIRSLGHAVAFMGLAPLRDLVIVAAVSRFELETKIFSGKSFWHNAFLTGRVAEFLVTYLKLEFAPEQGFLVGSTCNIGKIVQAIIQPRQADLYTMEMENLSILGNWRMAEQRHRGFEHTILGEIGATLWGFPDELLNGIAQHHNMPAEVKGRGITLSEVAGLANQLCHWVALDTHQIDQPLFKALLQRFKISEQHLDAIIPELQLLKQAQISA